MEKINANIDENYKNGSIIVLDEFSNALIIK